MPAARFKRRKSARPAEITHAAMEAFAEHGYEATRVDDVARRAGVSKGLLYLYFKTKEELFKAVIRSFISPHVANLTETIEATDVSVAEFLRGPFLATAKKLPRSPLRILIRLMVSEGPKHPDLTAFYWENVVSPALGAMHTLFTRGVDRGEVRASALNEFPQLLVTPVLFSALWMIVFERHQTLDIESMLEAHVEFVLNAIVNDGMAS